MRGLNGRARRNVVRDLVTQERVSLVCLHETKLSVICNSLANEILGSMFDYDYMSSANVAGGVLFGWQRDQWVVSQVDKRRFFLSAKVANTATPQDCWWLTVVYGPQADQEKVEFLDEFRQFRMTADGPWVLCGDFNMIYRTEVKSNDCLDRRCMRRFRAFIDAVELEELHLVGRRFTWSSERDQPTLEWLDRVFATTG